MPKGIKSSARQLAKKARATLMGVWLAVPFGNICSLKNGANTITLKKNLWVIVSDGKSSDAMPINFVSQEMQMKIADVMRSMGYPEPESAEPIASS